jgi:hypothetical protein
VVPYIVDIKKKRKVWKRQRRGNSFSECANAEPSCIKLRLELCQASIWGQILNHGKLGIKSKLPNFSGPFSGMHSSRLYEIIITRAFPREFQIAPTLHITLVPCGLRRMSWRCGPWAPGVHRLSFVPSGPAPSSPLDTSIDSLYTSLLTCTI